MASGAWIEYNMFDELANDLPGEVAKIVLIAAMRVAARAQLKMSLPKHGRTYRTSPIKKVVSSKGKLAKELKAAGLKYGTRLTKKGKEQSVFVTGYKMHRASAPGEAPAVDTGHLTNSVQVRMIGTLTAEIAFTAEYAAPLEYGSAHVAARPFLLPSLEEERASFEDELRKVIE